MDAFRQLTGGVRFNKKHLPPTASSKPQQPSSALPSELDFFGSSPSAVAGASGATATEAEGSTKKKSKKRKRNEDAATAAAETNFDWPAFLRSKRIKFTGLDPPNPVRSISELVQSYKCPTILAENWEKMGMKDPTGVQTAAWGVMLSKRDLLACAPTGSGKTLAFILPLLLLNPPSTIDHTSTSTSISTKTRPTALILEPTRELAMQVWRETTKLATSGGWVVKILGEDHKGKHKVKGRGKGKKRREAKKAKKVEAAKAAQKDEDEENSDDEDEEEDEEEEDEESEEESVSVPIAPVPTDESSKGIGQVDILITTPLRLIYAVKSGLIDLTNVRNLVLDETDKLFELNFVEQTDEIIAACSHPDLRKGMFSATMPSGVEEMAKSVMSGGGVGLIRAIIGHKDSATETISQSLHFVGAEDHKLLTLRSLITEGGFTPPVLIFVQSILRAKELSTELLLDGINADCIHAERTSEDRDRVVTEFAEGKVWCLIATDVMSRGVDFKGVKLVINYDFPQSGGSYIHRIGRTGRAGKEGRAITFFTKADGVHLKSIVNIMRASGCEVPQWMLDLKNPTQDEKKRLKLKPIGRKDVSQTTGAGAGDKSDRKNLSGKRKRVMGGKVPGEEKKKTKRERKDVGLDE